MISPNFSHITRAFALLWLNMLVGIPVLGQHLIHAVKVALCYGNDEYLHIFYIFHLYVSYSSQMEELK